MVSRTRSSSPRRELRARPRLPWIDVATAICEALLSASFASEPPGAGERQKQVFTPLRTCLERTYALHSCWHSLTLGAGEIFLGTWLGLRTRPEGRCACLRPQAEFARASVRGLRRSKISLRTRGGCAKNQTMRGALASQGYSRVLCGFARNISSFWRKFNFIPTNVGHVRFIFLSSLRSDQRAAD
jgi:hypothetical protein